MKKYIWGSYQEKVYSIFEISKSRDQVVLRIVGTEKHLTLHKLEIIKEEDDFWIVKYQNSRLKIYKKGGIPISYSWNSPLLRGAWSDTKVEVARSLKFLNPAKHGTSVQGILIKFNDSQGYDLGSAKIAINQSMLKKRYKRQDKKIGSTIPIPSLDFRVKIILSTKENQYKGKHEVSHTTELGELVLYFEDIITFRLNSF